MTKIKVKRHGPRETKIPIKKTIGQVGLGEETITFRKVDVAEFPVEIVEALRKVESEAIFREVIKIAKQMRRADRIFAVAERHIQWMNITKR
jgi:hypothetical protein